MEDATYHAILERVANGELVTDICAEYGISRALVWKKSEVTDEGVTFTRARVSQAHGMAEDTIKLADSAQGMDSDGVAAVRLRVDTRKWLVTKIAPRLYGDKLQVDATLDVSAMSREQQLQRLTALLATARITQPDAVQLLTASTSRDTLGEVGGSDTETVGGGAE